MFFNSWFVIYFLLHTLSWSESIEKKAVKDEDASIDLEVGNAYSSPELSSIDSDKAIPNKQDQIATEVFLVSSDATDYKSDNEAMIITPAEQPPENLTPDQKKGIV